MLAYIRQQRRAHIVETASRFARDLKVQEVGFAKLQALGIKLVAADSPQSFLDDTPAGIGLAQKIAAEELQPICSPNFESSRPLRA